MVEFTSHSRSQIAYTVRRRKSYRRYYYESLNISINFTNRALYKERTVKNALTDAPKKKK